MERAELEALVHETGCAETHGGYVFLRDPHWSAAQLEMLRTFKSKIQNPKSKIDQGWLCVPTGGSSGGLKFARHDEVTLAAAVRGFCAHFRLERVNAIDVLPPWHVSGLMARVRCAATGGRHVAWDWKRLEAGEVPVGSEHEYWVLSLVPTQLRRLLQVPAMRAWLSRLHLIFLGGGPVWPELAEAARAARLPVVLSYGMTETAAMVAAQRAGDFAQGDRSSGVSLPHARIAVGGDDVVRVAGASLMRGYLGESDLIGDFVTADNGQLDEIDRLRIIGRRDDVAISGGEKVDLTAIETVLRGLDGFTDVAVLALPDAEWGEAVAVCYVGEGAGEQVINRHLGRYQRPKHWLAFAPEDWPRNAQGKLNRAALRQAALARIYPRG